MLLVINISIQAQNKTFGKVSKAELQMKSYEKDSTADALVLLDIGRVSMDYVGSDLFMVIEQHRRVKIFNKEGYGQADIEIPYRTGKQGERIRGLKAKVYWMENGQMKSLKLSKKDFVDEKVSKNLRLKKIIFPKIKEGAIIEYRYKKQTPNIYLHSWSFQDDIPVKFSEYSTEIPSRFFNYVKIVQDYGWVRHVINNSQKNIFFGTERVSGNINKWEARDLPRFVAEKYMTHYSNHIVKIEFQLKRFMDESIFSTWKDLDKSLLESAYFGKQLKRKTFGGDILQKVASLSANEAKAQKIFEAVKAKMKYNEVETRYVNTTLKKAYEKGEGNAADINLMLINLLRRAGFKRVLPIILSTRTHAQVNQFYPLLNKFNYVVALLVVDKKAYFLDATDKFMPFNLLPSRCLSGMGRIVADYEVQNPWVALNQGSQKYKENVTSELILNEEGMLAGNITTTDEGYSALIERRKIEERKKKASKKKKDEEEGENEEDNYEEDEKADLKTLKILKAAIENLETLEKPLLTKLEVNIEDKVQKAGNMMYLNPMLYWQLKENPFKLKDRKFPVDFGYHLNRNFYVKISLPKGYAVESLPKQLSLALPGRQAVFLYSARQFGDAILVNSRLAINRSNFKPEQYTNLKAFFEKVIAKQAEQIVLKKK
ncbi:hypothetical protein BKI52_37425 [marine bacterium AO1-C]|nr:hypothetical protein BKI52_37425 [marine bacterium AO1-C]